MRYNPFPASISYREYDSLGFLVKPERGLERIVHTQEEQEAFVREVEAMPENWQLEAVVRIADIEACNAARELAADTLAGAIPFLGQFGARDILARAHDSVAANLGGRVYLDAVQAGVCGGRVCCDAENFIVRHTVKREGR